MSLRIGIRPVLKTGVFIALGFMVAGVGCSKLAEQPQSITVVSNALANQAKMTTLRAKTSFSFKTKQEIQVSVSDLTSENNAGKQVRIYGVYENKSYLIASGIFDMEGNYSAAIQVPVHYTSLKIEKVQTGGEILSAELPVDSDQISYSFVPSLSDYIGGSQ